MQMINGNLVLGTDYTDYMSFRHGLHGLHGFLRKSLVFVILSEAKNLPNALGNASLRSLDKRNP